MFKNLLKQDKGGNYLILDVKIKYIFHFYSSKLMVQTISLIEDMYSFQHIILGSDLNLIFDKDLDSMNYKHLSNLKLD